jgi:hypothetical protein
LCRDKRTSVLQIPQRNSSSCAWRLSVVPFCPQVAGKREPEQEAQAQAWIETVVGERFPPGVPYEDVLRDGIIFCKLMNKLQSGIITKINTSGGDYKMMDNLNQ